MKEKNAIYNRSDRQIRFLYTRVQRYRTTAPGRLQSPPPQIGRRLQSSSHFPSTDRWSHWIFIALFSITRYLRDLALYAASLSVRQRDIGPGDLRSFRSFTTTASLGTHPPGPARVRGAACKRYSRDTHATLDRGRWKRRNIRFHINISVRVSAYRVGIVAPSSSSLAFLSC